ncbi:MAG: MFS transporter [Chloroflexota bacterium]|nr:MFS transporter [Chloroflexota bacterium]
MSTNNGNHREHSDPTLIPVAADTGSTLPMPQGQEEVKANFLTVLRNSGFRNLWVGQLVSQVGDYFSFLTTMIVVSSFSDDVSATTLAVSGMMLANSLPRLLFGMLAGVFVDRWDRRTTMLVSDLIRVGLALAMIPAVIAQNLWAMYVLGFMLSTVGTIFLPAKGAIIPSLVPKEQLIAANSLTQSTMFLSILLGPAFGSLTLAIAGEGNQWVAFLIDAATYVVSAIAIWMIRVPKELTMPVKAEAPLSQVSAVRRVWDEMVVGIKLMFVNRTMSTLAVVFMVTMLGIGAVNVLWVVYLKMRFNYDETELAWRFGLLDICFAAGMLVSTVVAGNFLSHLSPKWFVVVALLGAGVFLAPTGYVPDYLVLALLSVGMGLFVAPINTGATTLMQIVVPNEQLGRANGGISTITESASVTSMSLAGFLGWLVGVPAVFLIGGLLCIAAGVLAWVRLPALTLKDMPAEVVAEEEREREVA